MHGIILAAAATRAHHHSPSATRCDRKLMVLTTAPINTIRAREGAWAACAERAEPRRTAAARSLGRSAALDPLVPVWGCLRRAQSGLRLRRFGRRGSSKSAPNGAGLAWRRWQAVLGPSRAVSAAIRLRFSRPRVNLQNACVFKRYLVLSRYNLPYVLRHWSQSVPTVCVL